MIYPHGDIESLGADIFAVRGSIRINLLMRISRNMGIVRDGSELTLVNPIQLRPETERKLAELGEVKNIVRLGAFHGIDDPYYVKKFAAQFWSQPNGKTYTEPLIDIEIGMGGLTPTSDSEFFEFRGTKEPECALLLKRGKGVLLTCDAIQNYGDYSFNNWLAKLVMPRMGFRKTTIVGPIWLKLMTPENESLESEFLRLLELKFDKLLSAHGTFLEQDAHEAVKVAVRSAFSNRID